MPDIFQEFSKLLYRTDSVEETSQSLFDITTGDVVGFNVVDLMGDSLDLGNTAGDMGGNISLTGGFIQSTGFVTGSSGTGWRLDSSGNLEASTGTFRGTLDAATIIGSVFKTADDGIARLEIRSNDSEFFPNNIVFVNSSDSVYGSISASAVSEALTTDIDGGVIITTNSTSEIAIGHGSTLSAGATTGFVWSQSIGSVPTGTPSTSFSDRVPFLFNTGNNALHFYNSGWQTIAGADVQEFTGDGTWTKPTGATAVHVIVIGAGGGAGSGAVGTNGAIRYGGAAGGGGSVLERTFQGSALGSTEAITVAPGGVGGASQTSDSSEGVDGAISTGSTAFGSWMTAYNGGEGRGAIATGLSNGGGGASAVDSAVQSGSNGLGGDPTAGEADGVHMQGVDADNTNYRNGYNADRGGASGGGGSSISGTSRVGGSSLYSGGGGGGGARTETNDDANNGGDGGTTGAYTVGGGGIGGDWDGSVPLRDGQPGGFLEGGGGGGSDRSQDGHDGGVGGIGGGGGGGGATRNTFDSGKGGDGGDGIVIIISYF